MTETSKDRGRGNPAAPAVQSREATPRKRHPLGIMLVGTLTAIGGVALLLIE